MAQTAVEPLLNGQPLSRGLTPSEMAAMNRLVHNAIGSGDVLRLRLRDLTGGVFYSDDGSGFNQRPADEALAAAHGSKVLRRTRLNSDSVDTGRAGPTAVEVYLPLRSGNPQHQVGIRWQHPDQGLLFPHSFVPTACDLAQGHRYARPMPKLQLSE
jgi:hypothetical protein